MVGWIRDVGEAVGHGLRRTWARVSDELSLGISKMKFSKMGGF